MILVDISIYLILGNYTFLVPNLIFVKDLIAKSVVNSPSMKTLTDKLSNLPVDIKPVYEIEKMYK